MEYSDINGRIESFDQSVRSLNQRLRAVERRLSANNDGTDIINDATDDIGINPDIEELRAELQQLRDAQQSLTDECAHIKTHEFTPLNETAVKLQHDIQAVNSQIAELTRMQTSIKEDALAAIGTLQGTYISKIQMLSDELEEVKLRLIRQEDMNKITIGKIKVPVELSGIIASIALIVTGYLIWSDRWDIIRSTYYPIWLAVFFAVAVIAKFVMANRKSKLS
jgi:predicted  nucleic acid-binding Zn-ribbon protein